MGPGFGHKGVDLRLDPKFKDTQILKKDPLWYPGPVKGSIGDSICPFWLGPPHTWWCMQGCHLCGVYH